MGECISLGKSKNRRSTDPALDSSWMKVSGCFDRFTFLQKIDSLAYENTQIYLSLKGYELEKNKSDKPYNSKYLQKNLEKFKKGVPNRKMADFLCCLFNISADPYKQFNFPSKKVLEPYQIKGDKPYFGRKSVSSNFLTVQGLKTMEKILFFLQAKFSDISYCPMLPRIVQMLLWYVPEKIALKIVLNLIEETENPSSSDSKQFIITSPLKAKALIRKSLSQVKGEFHKRNARKIVGEAIDELLTTIVPAEYLPQVFLGYLIFGLEFISGLAAALFNEIKSNPHPTVEDLKDVCKGVLLIDKIFKQFNPVEYEHESGYSSISAMSDVLVNFVPRFSRPAKIFTDEDQKLRVFSALPKIYQLGGIDLAFSLEYDGLCIADLDAAWHQEGSASFLVIKNWDVLIGVYFDRNLSLIEEKVENSQCILFRWDTETAMFYHRERKPLQYKYTSEGIIIGNDQETTIKLHRSLLDANNFESTIFNSSQLLQDSEFEIHKLELYLFK